MFHLLARLLRRLTRRLSWQNLMVLLLLQGGGSWLLLHLAGETELAAPSVFFYYNAVVISTVGFGDYSPVTDAGRWAVALYQIPFGLLVFGSFIGKLTQTLVTWVRRGMSGKADYSHFSGHTLLFGWNGMQTERIVDLLLADSASREQEILLCVTQDMEHPFPERDQVKFAHLQSFTNPEELARVGLARAGRILVDGEDDDQTLTTSLALSAKAAPEAHLCAWFTEASKAELLRLHCPNVEVSSSKEAEILVRSLQDPGASLIQEQIFSTLLGPTLYRIQVPQSAGALTYGNLLSRFKQQHNATLLGTSSQASGQDITLNPAAEAPVHGGCFLYYICPERLQSTDISWE
ncbi:potassium channel family protein [Zobellella maritima]|uniref:potassium channel family protein n=1 Tax=Zobellella maritima TaxID=2059725 RepID=UPI000E307E69|nr:potassium channel family protein [Zobellella maritima]